MDVAKTGGPLAPSPEQPPAAARSMVDAGPDGGFAAVLAGSRTVEVVGERALRASVTPSPTVTGEAAGGGFSWQRLADSALRAEDRIDAMIEAGRRGQAFSASQLLGLQMEVFRYSQTVEVISRTTDKLIGGLKQALGTQV